MARRFANEGFDIGLIARDRTRLDTLVRELAEAGVRASPAAADARDAVALRRALRELAAADGPPGVLCVSPLPDVGLIKAVLDTTPEDLLASLELGIGALAAATREVLPAMR